MGMIFSLIFGFDSAANEFQAISRKMHDPVDVSEYLLANISYRSDQSLLDENRSATETIALGYGDCEDFSILAAKFLEDLGYSPELYLVVGQDNAHCICVWQDEDGFAYMDNGHLVRVSAIAQIAGEIFENPVYFGKYIA